MIAFGSTIFERYFPMRLNSLAVAAAVIFTNFISLSQAIAAPSKTADACQQALGFVQVDLTTPNLSFGGMTPFGLSPARASKPRRRGRFLVSGLCNRRSISLRRRGDSR